MSDGTRVPVIAGLAVGIALIIALSVIASSSPLFVKLDSNDDYLRYASQLSEVRSFLTSYPNAFAGVYTTPILTDDNYQVDYIVGRHLKDTSYNGQDIAYLQMIIDPKGTVSIITISCTSLEGEDLLSSPPTVDVSGFLQASKHCPSQ